MSTTIKSAIRSFFTLRPVRDKNTSTATAIWLSIAIFFTQAGDALSTVLGLGLGATESNGVMAKFIEEQGYNAFFGLKAAASAFLIWVFWKRPAAAGFVICLYTAVIVNNLLAGIGHL
jgi:hypothetical protein